MKNLKTIGSILAISVALLTFPACKKCKNEQPKARIVNNGTKVASVQIKTSGGSTQNINGINGGTASAYESFASGVTTFTIMVEKVEYVTTVSMSECYNYDIAIDANNNVTANGTDLNK